MAKFKSWLYIAFVLVVCLFSAVPGAQAAPDMKMYILDGGYIELDQNWILSGASYGTKDNPNAPSKWVKIPCYQVLVQHPEKGWILFDTGNHPDAMNGEWPGAMGSIFPFYHTEKQTLVNQLASVGLKPEDVSHVILSHGHMDHAGGLYLFAQTADVYWGRGDYDLVQKLLFTKPDTKVVGSYIKTEMEIPIKHLNFVDKDTPFADGIEIVHLPGHTPGLLGMVVHLKEATYIFPSDAVYLAENYGPPARATGYTHDSLTYWDSIEKVRFLEKKYNGKVMFSHDINQFQTYKLAPNFYQ